MNKFHIIIALSVAVLAYTVLVNNKNKNTVVPTVSEMIKTLKQEGSKILKKNVEVPQTYDEDTFVPDEHVISKYSPLTLENKNVDLSNIHVGDLNDEQNYLFNPVNVGESFHDFSKEIKKSDAGSGSLEELNTQYDKQVRDEYFQTLIELEKRGGNSHN